VLLLVCVQFSVFDDLWPFIRDVVKSVIVLDAPGTKRRSAQLTILSVTGMVRLIIVAII
jgi:hypothetical protein